MNKDIKKTLGFLLISLLLVCSVVSPAYAEQLAGPIYSGRPNVVWNVSLIEVVTVHVLNTTPYDMELSSSDFKDFYTVNSVYPQEKGTSVDPTAFTPSGIPYKIPAKSGASFVVSWLDTASSSNPEFNTNEVYPDRNLAYTMKQVVSNYDPSNCLNNITTGDVTIHLDFNRVKEQQDSLKGDIFKLIVSGAAFVVDVAEFAVEPNPLSFMGYLISAEEIGSTAKEIAARGGTSDQTYFSAYVLPMGNSTTGNFPATYAPTKSYTSNEQAAPYDGLYSQHGTNGGGCPQAYIIPAVVVQRETGASDTHLDGHLPVVFVTLATSVDWTSAMHSQQQVTMQASAAGNRITQHLQREGKKGHVAFIKLARTLNQSEFALFDGAYKAIEQKKSLSREQEAFLLRFAEALEKHETSLPKMKNPSVHTNK